MRKIKKSIQCTTEPLQELIDNGETIDFRLNEPQWADLEIGDVIEYWEDFTGWQTEPAPHSRKVLATLTHVFKAKSFIDLMNHPDAEIFFRGQDKNAILDDLRQWWSEDKEKQTGVLGLKVRLIQN